MIAEGPFGETRQFQSHLGSAGQLQTAGEDEKVEEQLPVSASPVAPFLQGLSQPETIPGA